MCSGLQHEDYVALMMSHLRYNHPIIILCMDLYTWVTLRNDVTLGLHDWRCVVEESLKMPKMLQKGLMCSMRSHPLKSF